MGEPVLPWYGAGAVVRRQAIAVAVVGRGNAGPIYDV
jgi:hypothetical protein